ncbi:MAG: sensor histidine kinase [Pedobacter sp.]|uniref:tetratricopeptide repeat-containing sensor histidine kinase n=1 Tax=Pedobacter sp. TaxID=1411316 RepID=UPI0035650032
MRHLLLFLTALVTSLSASAQTTINKDSLLRALPIAKKDSNKVKLMLQLGKLYENNFPDTAMRIYREAHVLSSEISYFDGCLKSNGRMANLYSNLGKNDSAIVLFKDNLHKAQQKADSLQMGIAFSNLGSTYRKLSMNNEAIINFEQGLKLIEKFGSKPMVANTYNNLQLFYHSLPNYKKAIEYGQKAIEMAKQLKDNEILMRALSNISMTYKRVNELKSSQKMLNEALAIADKLDDHFAKGAILINLSDLCLQQGDYANAELYAATSLKLHREVKSKDGECLSLQGLALANLQKKNYGTAKQYAENALAIANAENYNQENANCFRILSNISYALHDVVSGERYYRKALAQEEEIANETYVENAANFEKHYESEKKEAQIKLQQASIKQKNILNAILIGSAAALLIISLLSYRNYSNKRKLQQQRISELETEKQLTATEAVLKGEEQERTRLAKDLHDGLGGMLSGIKHSFGTMKGNLIMTPENSLAFNRSMDMLDSSIKEMRRVAHNMMPEALVKFGLDRALKDFCTDINLSGALKVNYQSIGMQDVSLDDTTAITLFRIVQELLNNTVKHAAATHVIVQLAKAEKTITVTVEDDGKGFNPNLLTETHGIGWANIKNRVDFLKGKVDVKSEPDHGTSVLIEFKV